MPQKIINIGSRELAGDGESLRSAFGKVNENFDELYNLSGSQLGPTGPAGNTGPAGPTGPAGATGISSTSSLINGSFTTTLNSFGNLLTSGSVLPKNSNQYNLGSDLNRWNTIYVNTFTMRQAVVVGDYDSDNYTRIRHLEDIPYIDGKYKSYGFNSTYEQMTVIVNEDASMNQVIYLGDTGPDDTESLFGIGVADNVSNNFGNPTTGTETTWIKKLELSGQGNLFLSSGTVYVSSSSMYFNNVELSISSSTGISINGVEVSYGNIVTTVPSTSKGSIGDIAGKIAVSYDRIYFCGADYNGVDDIWSYTQMTTGAWS